MISLVKYFLTAVVLTVAFAGMGLFAKNAQADSFGAQLENGLGKADEENNSKSRYGIIRAWMLITTKDSDLNLNKLAEIEKAAVCSTPNAGAVILSKKIKDLKGNILLDNSYIYMNDTLQALKNGDCIAAVVSHGITTRDDFSVNFKIATILTSEVNRPDFVSLPQHLIIASAK